MRTNIEIDDDLMEAAMRASGVPTKRAAVEEGLRLLIQTKAQTIVRSLRSRVTWIGDLESSRSSRTTSDRT
ncbi:MAG TPA: type II toxin-antitoxin system VapB family antitoxin [Vicinamibacterales bacterium]|jgi:Arc/MetJ family transcription regulator